MKHLPFFLMFIVGCATSAKYEAKLDTWINADVNELMQSWGYPINSFKIPNGNTVYIYSSNRNVTMPIQSTSTYDSFSNTVNTMTTGGQTLGFWCKTFFEANARNKIVTWRWEGNNCTSY